MYVHNLYIIGTFQFFAFTFQKLTIFSFIQPLWLYKKKFIILNFFFFNFTLHIGTYLKIMQKIT